MGVAGRIKLRWQLKRQMQTRRPQIGVAFLPGALILVVIEVLRCTQRGADGLYVGDIMAMDSDRNVMGQPLETCSLSPLTGFRRDGNCRVRVEDAGVHGVCAEATADFLAFTGQQGNDLTTPNPAYAFPGLKPGDRWCLCANRWREAEENGVAPPVVLAATHAGVLADIPLSRLLHHAVVDGSGN